MVGGETASGFGSLGKWARGCRDCLVFLNGFKNRGDSFTRGDDVPCWETASGSDVNLPFASCAEQIDLDLFFHALILRILV